MEPKARPRRRKPTIDDVARPRRRKPTIDDVAREAGVSVATVSRALRGLPSVADSTRRRVVEAATRLRYQADPSAARLASGRTMTIALVAPFFGTWHTGEALAGIEEVLSDRGYDLLITASGLASDGDHFLETVTALDRRVDGVLTIDLYRHTPEPAPLPALPLPVVTIGELLRGHSGVAIPDEEAAERATRHLLELGHRRIALMTSPTQNASPVPELREKGFRRAMADADAGVDPSLVVDGRFELEGGAEAMAALLALRRPPTAVFCLSDLMAFGAMQTCRELSVAVPGDMSIMGFDDQEVASAAGLTTMRQEVRAMGARAASMLIDRLEKPNSAAVHEQSGVELVVRASTGPPRPGRGRSG